MSNDIDEGILLVYTNSYVHDYTHHESVNKLLKNELNTDEWCLYVIPPHYIIDSMFNGKGQMDLISVYNGISLKEIDMLDKAEKNTIHLNPVLSGLLYDYGVWSVLMKALDDNFMFKYIDIPFEVFDAIPDKTGEDAKITEEMYNSNSESVLNMVQSLTTHKITKLH